MELLLLIAFAAFLFTLILAPKRDHRPSMGVMVSRSRSVHRPDTFFCGNCHGTGDEGFGIMPDSAGDCEACDGRGYIKVDPNAKTMTLSEALAFAERTNNKG